MKIMSREIEKVKNNLYQEENCFVHFYFSNEGYKPIDPPVRANEFSCPFCGGNDFFVFSVPNEMKAWGCGAICRSSRLVSHTKDTDHTPKVKRSLEWPLFCEMSDLGDLNHSVAFEKIHQPPERIDYFMKFALHPLGILLFQGSKGSGKTYASLGICEFFARKSISIVFTMASKMYQNWMKSKGDPKNNYIPSLKNCLLLVIDDFGIGENSIDFMTFFFELIDHRIQWSNRGTIITTNLDDKKFSDYCGEALGDRIRTGQKFIFKEKSRRK
jgi:hypothetical protein